MKRYDSYKDSGIEWIGDIPSDWEVKKLNYCFSLIGSGTTPTASNQEYYECGSLNWLQTGDLNDSEINETSKKITQKAIMDYPSLRFYPINSLVIAMYGATIGKTGILKIESSVNQACCVISNPLNLNYKFAFYWLNSIQKHIISLSYGGGQPNINQEQIRNLKIQLPPKSEQIAIASFLDQKTAEIDQLIADKKRLIELYEEEKTAVINQAVTKGIDPNVKMKDSGIEWLGKIPEHWEVKRLKYLLKQKKGSLKTGPFGSQLKTSDLSQNGTYKVYTQRNVLDNNFNTGDDRIDVSKFESLKEFLIDAKDILFTSRGSIGKCSIFPSESEQGILHPCLIRIQTDSSKVSEEWIVKYVNESSYFIDNAKYESNSTIIDVIYGGTLKEIFLPIPPLAEQNSIVDFIESKCSRINAKIEKTKRLIDLLAEYRTTLISEVVTGKIKVI